jgi:hypothetical protein
MDGPLKQVRKNPRPCGAVRGEPQPDPRGARAQNDVYVVLSANSEHRRTKTLYSNTHSGTPVRHRRRRCASRGKGRASSLRVETFWKACKLASSATFAARQTRTSHPSPAGPADTGLTRRRSGRTRSPSSGRSRSTARCRASSCSRPGTKTRCAGRVAPLGDRRRTGRSWPVSLAARARADVVVLPRPANSGTESDDRQLAPATQCLDERPDLPARPRLNAAHRGRTI